jgi:hypothetical protein
MDKTANKALLESNPFYWAIMLKEMIDNINIANSKEVHDLADFICQLGVGPSWNEGEMVHDVNLEDKLFNELVFNLVSENNVLRVALIGIFHNDTFLPDDHPNKLATKGYDVELARFFSCNPRKEWFR